MASLAPTPRAPLQYSQAAGAVKRDKGYIDRASEQASIQATHRTRRERGAGAGWQHSTQQAAAAATRLYTYALFLLPQQQCTARFVRRSSSSRPINSWQAYHGVMASHGAIVGNAH